MVSRRGIRKIQTTAGIRYITGRNVGKGEFQVSTSGKIFKTKKGALRAIGKK